MHAARSETHACLLQQYEHADGESHAAAGLMQDLTLCADHEGMLCDNNFACMFTSRRTCGFICSKQLPMTPGLPEAIGSLPLA
jgi:hypothetical protein